jgi:uncharacterized membrane protein required for colicin V production
MTGGIAPRWWPVALTIMNAVDLVIGAVVLTGALLGAQRGVLRQVAVAAAFYASLVVSAQNYGAIADMLIEQLPRVDYTIASTYTLVGLTVLGTFVLVWLSQQVYRTTALPGLQVVDRLAGASLGVLWAWAVVAFALTVALYGISFPWGSQEPLRRDVAGALVHSELVGTARLSWPQLRDSLAPWLPGGLPAPLTG